MCNSVLQSGFLVWNPARSYFSAGNPTLLLHHRPSVEMTSLSRATRWRAGSHRASLTPPSGARWSIQAPKPRALASMSRSPNEPSSPTSPCESRPIQPKPPLRRNFWWLDFTFLLQECEWDHICWFGEREDRSQELVRPGQSQRQGGRHRQVPDWAAGFQASAGWSSTTLTDMFLLHRANSQDVETFKTEVHVPPGSNIEFELNYQEMIHRKLGFYEHSLYLQPGRVVPHFQVTTSRCVCVCMPACVVPIIPDSASL